MGRGGRGRSQTPIGRGNNARGLRRGRGALRGRRGNQVCQRKCNLLHDASLHAIIYQLFQSIEGYEWAWEF